MKSTALSNGQASTSSPAAPAPGYGGSSRDELLAIYRTMLLSRRLDDKEIQLKNQSLIFFQISGAGHEAVLVAAGLQLRAGYDWFYPYYRDRALCLALGVTPYEMLLAAVGAKDDPASGGRQMPSHWGHVRLNIVSQSSPTGTQCLQAIGCAEAGMLYERINEIPDRLQRFKQDEVVYVSLGDGTASEGEFWESLNAACVRKLPVVFLVEDNGYAISVPVEVQTPGGDLSRLVESFPGLGVFRCDGTDVIASLQTMKQAVAYARERRGPAFVHAKVVRPYSHSLSDDERLYKTPAERAEEATRDPIIKFAARLTADGLVTEAELADIARDVDREIKEAAEAAVKAAKPTKDTAGLWVYSPDIDPTSPAFDAPRPGRRQARHDGRGDQPDAEGRNGGQPAHRRLRRGRRRCHAGGESVGSAGQGRRVQGDARTAEGVRIRSCLQHGAGRSRHHRPRRRHGDARHQAGRRNPVLRLHLAGHDAAPQRSVDDAVPIEQSFLLSDGDPRRVGRLPAWRCAVSQPVRRKHLRALPGNSHRVPIERHGCRRAVAHRHSLRRPRAVHGAQAPLPPDLQQGALPGQQLHDPVRQGGRPSRGDGRRGRDLGRAGAAIAAGGAAGGEGRRQHDGDRSQDHHAVRLGRDRRGRPAHESRS